MPGIFQRLRAAPLTARMTWYTLGSVIAAATSAVTFAIGYGLGLSTTASSIIAFLAGAVPNWILNRRWAWKRRGRLNVGREVLAYAAVSALSLVASSLATAWTSAHAHSVTSDASLRTALVTGAYLAVFAVLFVAKFVLYELWIFSEEGARTAWRSRRQVWSAARANRTP